MRAKDLKGSSPFHFERRLAMSQISQEINLNLPIIRSHLSAQERRNSWFNIDVCEMKELFVIARNVLIWNKIYIFNF